MYWRYFKKYKIPFLVGTSCVFFEAVCDLLQPTIMAKIIDEGVKNSQMEQVIKLGLLMLGITLLGAVFATSRNLFAGYVSQSFGADLREEVFEKILSFGEESVDEIEAGSLITRMTNDTAQIVQFVNGMMRIFFKAPLTCIGSIVLAVMLSPTLSIVLFVAVGVVIGLITLSMKLSYARYAKVQKAVDKVNRILQEYLMGIRLVKAFGRYDEEGEKFETANSELAASTLATQKVIVFCSPLMSLTISLGIACILYIGSIMMGMGAIQVGKVAAFINYMTQILHSLVMITNIFNTFVRTKASTERVEEVLQSKTDTALLEGNQKWQKGAIRFDKVSFAYPGGSGTPVIKDLSFEVKQGETVAIIGPTGAGKSTLAWLLLRFYEVTSGTIWIGDQQLKNMEGRALREHIAIAPQKSMLFTGTIEENLRWGKEDASVEEMETAAHIAQAESFVTEMERSYESPLGQGGVNLSGGQKQRLSIARALLKKADLLILDDCTSALDGVTEAKVRQGLKEREGDQTVLVITQRISTAMGADHILVLDEGVKVGYGSHGELRASCPTYEQIYQSQIGEEEDYE